MKTNFFLYLSAIVLAACSRGDNTFIIEGTNTQTEEPVEIIAPVANNDAFFADKNTAYSFSDILNNDDNVEDVTVTLESTSSNNATITTNTNGTYTYTPATDFTGTDTFKYEVCTNATPQECSTATITITIVEDGVTDLFGNIPSELKAYYSTVTFSTNSETLKSELQEVTTNKHTNIIYYSGRHTPLLKADQDTGNSSNVILVYTGESRDKSFRDVTGSGKPEEFNTEHIYPQSLYKVSDSTDDIVKGDLHHLRYCDANTNSSRSNDKFVDGSGSAGSIGSAWYPGDEWKGDVARMILYIHLRYDKSISKVGDLDTFLEWNEEDPISDFEIQRNDIIADEQGNRNPFIDNPYLVTLIWGGTPAENKWE
ncbi:endonuclease I [Wenyingzhuangia heitensis]|uniref:Endonuclease I n=1 Tax=Wenyingzhuangia heitensis TaxID=1487859 RepID=A0ABX0U4S6_9FLAO|nr:endonuclease [Wenyingzhuangia heitensis]NIJ43797.1 endonuclease I [Wenyingzhuangia heitensis]